MNENTAHPRRLWLVETQDGGGYTVRETDVTPAQPDQPPERWSLYYVAGKAPWYTAALEIDAFRTKAEALERAIDDTDDMIYDWQDRKRELERQLALAEEEEVNEDNDA